MKADQSLHKKEVPNMDIKLDKQQMRIAFSLHDFSETDISMLSEKMKEFLSHEYADKEITLDIRL